MVKKIICPDEHRVNAILSGSHKIAKLTGIYYSDLFTLFGEPTLREVCDDEKVQVEFVFEFGGNYFSIYDYKTYSMKFTTKTLSTWSIGGHKTDRAFLTELKRIIKNKVNKAEIQNI
jgi:hypothetical protein